MVPGTSGSGATIWPVTHPVFIVQFYQSPSGMGTENGAYDTMAKSIQTVIPYASEDAMWLCSNVAAKYLKRHGFDTPQQVYLARKTSLDSTELKLKGGKKDLVSTGRIKYLTDDITTKFEDNKTFSQGIFYETILKLYIANNRSMASLANDSKFLDELKKSSVASVELWSYITDVDEDGSDTVTDICL